MEWMLQVVDEFDDYFGVLRLHAMGLQSDLGVVAGGFTVVSAILAAAWLGADALVMSGAVGALGLAGLLKMQRLMLPKH
jgi:hypothetical protein